MEASYLERIGPAINSYTKIMDTTGTSPALRLLIKENESPNKPLPFRDDVQNAL